MLTSKHAVSRSVSRIVSRWRPGSSGPETLDGLMADYDVRRMFDSTAATYDFQNKILSMWRDAHWRDMFIRYLRLSPGEVLGDLAVGTGDIAIKACRRVPGIRVVGVDFSGNMLRVARRKVREQGFAERIELHKADLRSLPLADELFDVVTISFGIRNIREQDAVLAECHRLLKPGGRLRIMEMAMPTVPVLGGVYRAYFERVMPVVGNWMSRTDYAYSYLVESVYAFPDDQAFESLVRNAGFESPSIVPLSYGSVKIYRAEKPGGR